jgi:hypothetical protein
VLTCGGSGTGGRPRRRPAAVGTHGARGLGEQGGGMEVPGETHGPTDQGLASACGPSGPRRGSVRDAHRLARRRACGRGRPRSNFTWPCLNGFFSKFLN